MRGFDRIPSMVQIWLAQMLVLLFFADPVIRLFQLVFRPETGILKTRFDWFDVFPWAIGAFSLHWLMRTIFRPRLGKVRWVPVHVAGPVPVWNGAAAVNYTFPSTHPSYVFMDALAVGFAYFIYWAWSSQMQERRVEAMIFLALGLLTPVARLVAWYILGIRPRPPAPEPEAVRHTEEMLRQAWRPVLAFYAILVPIFALTGGLGWYYAERDQRERIAAAIRIDANELAARPRYFEEIRDTSASLQQSRLGRIEIRDASDPQRCEHATVKSAVHFNLRARFGAAGETMLVVPPAQMVVLKRRLERAANLPIELLGILVRPPRPGAIPAWRQHVYCTLTNAATQPRWIFDVEQVLGK